MNLWHLVFFGLLVLTSGQNTAQSYEIIVATDFDGQVVSGSIDQLITEIRKGKAVRIGWQLDFDQDQQSDFDHWVDAGFITILGGHVFAQIDAIFVQGPDLAKPQVEIFPSSSRWTAVLGTNGLLKNRFIMDKPPKIEALEGQEIDTLATRKQAEEMRKVQSWKVATFWATSN